MADLERIDDELTALESMVGSDFFHRKGSNQVSISVEGLELFFNLPYGYPTSKAPQVSSNSCRLSESLKGFVQEKWAGEEMIWQICEAAINFKTTLQLDGAASNATREPVTGEAYLCILSLEHMRDRKQYEKSLSKFAGRTGVACHVIHSRTIKHSVQAVDSCNPIICLSSSNEEGVSAFLRHLRTEKVDVDGHGKSCLERKSTILHTLATFQALTFPCAPGSFSAVEVGTLAEAHETWKGIIAMRS
jgi:hypothetical protein